MPGAIIHWLVNTKLSRVVLIVFIVRWLLGSILLNDREWEIMQTLLTTPLTIATALVLIKTFSGKTDETSKIARSGGIIILFLVNWTAFFSAIRRARISDDNARRVFIYLSVIASATYYLDMH